MNKYIPDSVYMVCGEETQDCGVCSNSVFSPVVNGKVHDPLSGKVFCPFGMGETLNQNIMEDQFNLNRNLQRTPWGMAPQLDPRPLSKIGLSWRTS
jgi:hypothetical protein